MEIGKISFRKSGLKSGVVFGLRFFDIKIRRKCFGKRGLKRGVVHDQGFIDIKIRRQCLKKKVVLKEEWSVRNHKYLIERSFCGILFFLLLCCTVTAWPKQYKPLCSECRIFLVLTVI